MLALIYAPHLGQIHQASQGSFSDRSIDKPCHLYTSSVERIYSLAQLQDLRHLVLGLWFGRSTSRVFLLFRASHPSHDVGGSRTVPIGLLSGAPHLEQNTSSSLTLLPHFVQYDKLLTQSQIVYLLTGYLSHTFRVSIDRLSTLNWKTALEQSSTSTQYVKTFTMSMNVVAKGLAVAYGVCWLWLNCGCLSVEKEERGKASVYRIK